MATITEKSRTKEIIDRLQGIIDNASPVPLAAGKVTIYKDEVKSLLSELASQIDMELKTYHEVNDRKGKILKEAKKEAEQIIYQAEHSASRMRVSKRATNVAPLNYDMLDEEERGGLGNANEIYAASLIYTDEMLTEVTELIADAYHNIRSDYEIILQVLDEKLNTISENRAELMMGLQEMETEDRGQQILEIGQLLSNELYNERMKQKMASDEYEDGSVQLTLDLQEEQEEKARLAEERAQQAAQALAAVTAERDALMATVEQMKQEGMMETVRSVKTNGPVTTAPFLSRMSQASTVSAVTPETGSGAEIQNTAKVETEIFDGNTVAGSLRSGIMESEEEDYEIEYVDEDELEDGEEYEIEYVDEDDLEDGEEYEIEYVDEDELEDGEEYEIEYVDEDDLEDSDEYKEDVEHETETDEEIQVKADTKEADEEIQVNVDTKETDEEIQVKADSKEVEETIKELEVLEKDTEKAPVISHLKKSEKMTSVPSEKVAKMAEAVTTEKKYSGLISRAVANREKAEAAVSVEETDTIETAKLTESSQEQLKENKEVSESKEKDEDIKVDAKGNEYVQATMKFDEDFEIMEF